MKLIVLSDLHLWGPEDPMYRGMLKFIDTKLSSGDKFFILGDLFDLFVGNKKIFIQRYSELITRIRDLEKRNVEVFYVEGNHDFHLSGLFEKCPHVKICSNFLNYEWNGRKLHFCHGDQINRTDFFYHAFHLLTRNVFSQFIIEMAPGAWVDRVGRTLSKTSREYGNDQEASSDAVVLKFRNYACEQISNGADLVVIGHSHFLDDMRFRVNQREGQYVNVGYPRKHGKYLQLNFDDPFFKLINWEEIPASAALAEKVLASGAEASAEG